MVRNSLAILLVLVSMSAFAGTVAKGNADKGRNQFRQNCKSCHSKGGKGGEVTPLSKTVSQWRSYFQKGKHANGTLSLVMSEQQLRDVETFLAAHAADSEQPETCGK